ncbi:acyl-CoA thioesterase [Candidatus Acetothermia bacterium]|nr:acyl-CoA thioesterase [Candidatus Acetothermia bacterium]MBI3642532.1 acyl-CoA thioesterase [Candidatus Acetothermia bacterium]
MSSYRKSFEIRWSDVDPNGHARHTSYSDYAAHVRFGFMFEHGISYERLEAMGVGPVILKEELDYLRETKLSEKIEIEYSSLGLSKDGSHWKLRHDIFNSSGKRSVRITLSGGWIDMKSRKLIVPPDELFQIFQKIPQEKNFRELPPLVR